MKPTEQIDVATAERGTLGSGQAEPNARTSEPGNSQQSAPGLEPDGAHSRDTSDVQNNVLNTAPVDKSRTEAPSVDLGEGQVEHQPSHSQTKVRVDSMNKEKELRNGEGASVVSNK